MLQVYLDQLLEACNHLIAYSSGVQEFEVILGNKFLGIIKDISCECSWLLEELDFK